MIQLRAAAVWLAAGTTVLVVGRLCWPPLDTWSSTSSFADLVTAVAGLAVVGCLTWAWLVTSVVLLEVSRQLPGGLDVSRGSVVAPVWARRLVAAACGLAVLGGVGAAPATAGPAVAGHLEVGPRGALVMSAPAGSAAVSGSRALHRLDQQQRDEARDRSAPGGLTGLPMPDRPWGGLRPPASPAVGSAVGEVVVRPGDSLWALASAELGARADDAGIARRVQLLYAANRDVIGADPDLLRPGQRLHLPFPPTDTSSPR